MCASILYVDTDRNGTPDRLIDAVITDEQGSYQFNNINPLRVYIVEFIPPDGRELSPQNNSGNDSRDSDPNPNSGWTDPITLSPDEMEDSIDAGLMPIPDSASFIGIVFEDQNGDGVRALNEPGILGATVQLWHIPDSSITDNETPELEGSNASQQITPNGIQLAITMTDRNGLYQFVNVKPDQAYVIVFVQPTGRDFTLSDRGDNDSMDSDPEPLTGFTPEILVSSGEQKTSIDAGVTPLSQPASIGGRVNYMAASSMARTNTQLLEPQLSTEIGVAEIVVRLWTEGRNNRELDAAITLDQLVDVTETDSHGQYLFEGLDPTIRYIVEVSPPDGYELQAQGGDLQDPVDQFMGPITVQPDEYNDSTHATLRPTQPTVGYHFTQTLNGQQPNTPDDALYVNADDSLLFEYILTNTKLVTDPNNDNAIVWASLTITTTQPHRDDPSDFTTDLSEACNLPQVITPNTHYACQITQDADEFPTGQGIYAVPTVRAHSDNSLPMLSNPSPEHQVWYQTPPSPSTTYASIQGIVWEDISQNGLFDNQEPRIAGIVVALYEAAVGEPERLLASTTTTHSGNYQFSGLLPGQRYRVHVFLPNDNTYFTLQHVNGPGDELGSDSGTDSGTDSLAIDSDVDVTSGESDIIVMNVNNPNGFLNAGLIGFLDDKPSTMGSYVWLDRDGNGLQDVAESGTEPGLANVKVELLDQNGVIQATAATNNQGRYLFTPLDPGRYQVRFTRPITYLVTHSYVEGGLYSSRDNDIMTPVWQPITATNQTQISLIQTNITTTAVTAQFDVGVNETLLNIDAGFAKPVSLGDYVWLDSNEDGVQQMDEPGAADVQITLFSSQTSTALITTTTDATGHYAFAQLLPGEYYVQFHPPPGYQLTTKDSGSDEQFDSDADPETGISSLLFMTDESSGLSNDSPTSHLQLNNNTLDAGLVPNGDPINTPGEEPVYEPNDFSHKLFLPIVN